MSTPWRLRHHWPICLGIGTKWIISDDLVCSIYVHSYIHGKCMCIYHIRTVSINFELVHHIVSETKRINLICFHITTALSNCGDGSYLHREFCFHDWWKAQNYVQQKVSTHTWHRCPTCILSQLALHITLNSCTWSDERNRMQQVKVNHCI